MKQIFGILLSFSLLICSADMHAIEVDYIEAAAYACTDNTNVIGLTGISGISSQLLMEKNDKPIYFNEDFEDIQHIWSIYCFQYAIILTGIHGSYFATVAITTDNAKINVQFIGASRRLPHIEARSDKIIVSLYGDDREAEGEVIVRRISFTEPFILPNIANRSAQEAFPEITLSRTPHLKNRLTALSTCYSKRTKEEYTLLAYLDDNRKNHLTLLEGRTIRRSQTDYAVSDLPFIVTNSQCFEDATYLFGISDTGAQAAKFYFDMSGKAQVELIDVSKTLFDEIMLWSTNFGHFLRGFSK